MSGPHWRWPTGFPFKFHAEPMQSQARLLTSSVSWFVAGKVSLSLGELVQGGRWSLPRLPAVHAAAQTTGARVVNGLDRVGNLKDLEGGFFVISNHARRRFAEDWSQIVHEVRGKILKAVAGRMYAKQR
jgi:hypothetical protein